MLNSRAAIVVYAESPSRPAAIAEPKYRPDCAAAAPSVLAAASADGIITATVATATTPTTPVTSPLMMSDRLRRVPPRSAEGLVGTLASLSGQRPSRLGGTTGRPCHAIRQRRCGRRPPTRANMFEKFPEVLAGTGGSARV